jgi:hypothetical protein
LQHILKRPQTTARKIFVIMFFERCTKIKEIR